MLDVGEHLVIAIRQLFTKTLSKNYNHQYPQNFLQGITSQIGFICIYPSRHIISSSVFESYYVILQHAPI